MGRQVKRFIIIACLMACGCEFKNISREVSQKKPTSAVLVVTDVNWSQDIKTVAHDGHKWVIMSYCAGNAGAVSMLHHPDCECGK